MKLSVLAALRVLRFSRSWYADLMKESTLSRDVGIGCRNLQGAGPAGQPSHISTVDVLALRHPSNGTVVTVIG
jgi:hypothetical protein